MYYPTLSEIKSKRWDGNLIPVYREIVADMETPVSAFLKISHGGNSFLLESVEGGQRLARYSFIGTEPYRELTIWGKDNIRLCLLKDCHVFAVELSVISVMKRYAVLRNCHRLNVIR
jgi:anthranilate/para-aminobenzoate synthase component I